MPHESLDKPKWNDRADHDPRVISINSPEALVDAKTESEICVVSGDNSGLENPAVAAQLLRANGIKTPIVYTSKKEIPQQIKNDFFDSGGDILLIGEDVALLPKILVNLARRMRMLSHSSGELLSVPGLRINPSRLQVSAGERTENLTYYEYAILSLLARQYPKTVSHDQFWDEVFENNANRSSSLSSLMHKIRVKIAPCGIESDRNVGYRLVAAPRESK